jgi:SIT4-associating protein SAP185/190
MITFIKSMPNIIERMVDKIESPAVQDMLLRIVACEEAGVAGTVKVREENMERGLILSH